MLVKKYKPLAEKANYYSLLLFIFWLPLYDNFLPLILAIWIFTWLLSGNFKNRLTKFPKKDLFIGLLIYFILTLIFLFNPTDLDSDFFEVQQKLSLVFFPIILAGSSQKVKTNAKTIIVVFIIGNLAASVYCLSYTFFDCLQYSDGKYIIDYHITECNYNQSFWQLVNLRYNRFAYSYLSIFMHPSYFSMYINFSIIAILYFFRKGLVKKTYFKVLYGLLIIFFIFMLYLLQSRAAFLTFGVVIILIPIVELHKKLKKRFIFLTIAMLLAAITFVLTSSRIKTNINDFSNFLKSENKTELLKSDIRLQLWYTSIKVIEEHFWIGTSPANLNDELVKKYKELGFEKAADDNLNSHNQYLETFAGLGIFGFLSLLYIIIYTFIISIKERKYLLFFLMVILSINFLFEAMLNRMAGVLFMMFFVSLFVFLEKQSKEQISLDEIIE